MVGVRCRHGQNLGCQTTQLSTCGLALMGPVMSSLPVAAGLHPARRPRAPWHQGAHSVGHIAPAVYLCQYEVQRLSKVLPIETIGGWGGDPGAFLSILAHHGRPSPVGQAGDWDQEWHVETAGDPDAALGV